MKGNNLNVSVLLVLRASIIQYIEELPEKYKLVLSLYYFEDLNLREIGRVLSVTESRVSQLHTQAMLKLKEKLMPALKDELQVFQYKGYIMEENKDLTVKENLDEIISSDLSSKMEKETIDSVDNLQESTDLNKSGVDVNLIRNYPKSNKRVALYVDYYRVHHHYPTHHQGEEIRDEKTFDKPSSCYDNDLLGYSCRHLC